jgi:hypothetical protein
VLEKQVPKLVEEEREAMRDLRALLALPREKRVTRVERARNRFRSSALVRLLIAESRRAIHTSPDDSLRLAELARTVAHRNPRMAGSFDLLALATAQMANACRVGNNRRLADDHFNHARYIISQYDVTDPETHLGQGDTAAAEQAFIAARDGFVVEGNGYDAAMVAVEDLALLYLREGRTADVKRLAEEIYAILGAQDIHREAAAALMLFQEAARQEQLTVKVVREYVQYLREARTNPSLRFRQERVS